MNKIDFKNLMLKKLADYSLLERECEDILHFAADIVEMASEKLEAENNPKMQGYLKVSSMYIRHNLTEIYQDY